MAGYDINEVEQYIRKVATKLGINPDIAARVAKSEGLSNGGYQAKYRKNGKREPSYGPYQLLVGGGKTGFPEGLGNRFIKDTGLDPTDPSTVPQQIDYALNHAKKNGWGAWYGAKRVGIKPRQGIDEVVGPVETPETRAARFDTTPLELNTLPNTLEPVTQEPLSPQTLVPTEEQRAPVVPVAYTSEQTPVASTEAPSSALEMLKQFIPSGLMGDEASAEEPTVQQDIKPVPIADDPVDNRIDQGFDDAEPDETISERAMQVPRGLADVPFTPIDLGNLGLRGVKYLAEKFGRPDLGHNLDKNINELTDARHSVDQFLDNLFGTHEPKDWIDSGLRVAGSAALPIGTAASAAKGTLGSAAELILPGTVGGLKRIPGNVAVQTAVGEGIRDYTDPDNSYHSVREALTKDDDVTLQPVPSVAKHPLEVTVDQGTIDPRVPTYKFTTNDPMRYDTTRFAGTTGEDLTFRPSHNRLVDERAGSAAKNLDAAPLGPSSPGADPTSIPPSATDTVPIISGDTPLWQYLLGGVAVLAGGSAAISAAARGAEKILPKAPELGRTLRKAEEPISATTAKEAILTRQQDATYGVKSQLERAGMDPVEADRMTTLTRYSGSKATQEVALDTGQLPLSGGRLKPIGTNMPELKAMYEGIDEGKREAMELYAHALDEANTAKANKKFTGTNATRVWNQMTPTSQQAVKNLVTSDPAVAQFIAANRKMLNAAAESLVDSGVRSKAQMQALKAANPDYIPIVKAPETFAQRLSGWLGEGDSDSQRLYNDMLDFLKARDTGVATRGTLVDSTNAYVRGVIEFSQQNALRRTFFQQLNSTDTKSSLYNSIKKVKAQDGDNIVRYYDDGKAHYYKVADPSIASALKNAPGQSIGAITSIADSIRRNSQFFTTGTGAPWFALVTAIRDPMMLSLLRPKGTQFGYLDKLAQAATGGRIGVRGDPTAYIKELEGFATLLGTRAIRHMAEGTYKSLYQNGAIRSVLGPQKTKALADYMTRIYSNSQLAMSQRQGGVLTGYTRNLDDLNSKKIVELTKLGASKLAPGPLREMWHGYEAVIDSIQNAARYGFYRQNAKLGQKGANASRTVAGDLTMSGSRQTGFVINPRSPIHEKVSAKLLADYGGKVGGGLRNAVFFWNPAVQGTTALYRAMKQSPVGFATGMATAVMVPAVYGYYMSAMLGPEYTHYFFNRPDYKRGRTLYFPVPGRPPEEGIEIPILPEMGMYAYTAVSGIDYVLNLSGRFGKPDGPTLEGVGEWLGHSTKNIFTGLNPVGDDVLHSIPLVDTILASMGYKSFGTEIVKMPADAQANVSERTAGIIEGIMGSGASLVLGTYNAAADADTDMEGRVGRALDQLKFEAEKKLPSTLTGLYRVNSYDTEVATKYYRTLDKLHTISDNAKELLDSENQVRFNKYVPNDEMINVRERMSEPPNNPLFIKTAPLFQKLERDPRIGVQAFKDRLMAANDKVKELKSFNAGNIGKSRYKSLEEVQKVINETEKVRFYLMEKMLERYRVIENILGVKLEDLDPYAGPQARPSQRSEMITPVSPPILQPSSRPSS